MFTGEDRNGARAADSHAVNLHGGVRWSDGHVHHADECFLTSVKIATSAWRDVRGQGPSRIQRQQRLEICSCAIPGCCKP